jgi:hypothetical protein
LPAAKPQPLATDVGNKPDRKETFMFSTDESEALEDLKLELRRRFDIKTSKNELARVAVRVLLDDYRQHGETSDLIRRLTKASTK